MSSEPLQTDHWQVATARPAAVMLAVLSDDETLSRRATATLEREGKLVKVSAAGAEVGELARLDHDPDVLIVRRAANRPGLEHVLREASRRLPRTARVVVLPRPEEMEAGRLLSAGAHAFIPESSFQEALGFVVDAVVGGYVCVPRAMRHAVDPPQLSYRERQVLALAVTGRPNAEIADRLFISESTVKSHLASAYRQLGVHSRREASSAVLASADGLRRSILDTLGENVEQLR